MPLTLTQWWVQLDDETRLLAKKYGDTTYPDALTTPYTGVIVAGDMSPAHAINKMASLGAAIETNVMSGQNIKNKIETASKKLGAQLPDSTHFIPAITDEQSLLLAVVYYRSQYRFQEVQSLNGLVQKGILGVPGLEQNKPTIAKETAILRKVINDFCSANQEIARTAQLKFNELFTQPNEVGGDLFQPKRLSEHYIDYFGSLIIKSLETIKQTSHDKMHPAVLDSAKRINEQLNNTQIQLETLYLYKMLKEYTDGIQKHSEMTFDNFMEYINQNTEKNDDRAKLAKKIWCEAEEHAHTQKSFSEKFTEGVTTYTSGFLQNFVHTQLNPFAYITWVLGMDEASKSERFEHHFNAHVARKIASISEELSNQTNMKFEDLQTASSKDIGAILATHPKINLEINILRKSLNSYIHEVGHNNLIKFSTTSFIGWITKQFAKFELTSALLHDNIHYLQIASDTIKKIETLEQSLKKGDGNNSNYDHELSQIKTSMSERVTHVKRGSRYILFKKERDRAHKQINDVINNAAPDTSLEESTTRKNRDINADSQRFNKPTPPIATEVEAEKDENTQNFSHFKN